MAGAVTRAVKIDENDYLLTFGMEAMIAAETESGRGFYAMIAGGLSSAVEQCEMFRAVLKPGSELTRAEAAKLIDQAGPKQVVEWLVEGLNEYLGERKVAPAKRAGAKA